VCFLQVNRAELTRLRIEKIEMLIEPFVREGYFEI